MTKKELKELNNLEKSVDQYRNILESLKDTLDSPMFGSSEITFYCENERGHKRRNEYYIPLHMESKIRTMLLNYYTHMNQKVNYEFENTKIK